MSDWEINKGKCLRCGACVSVCPVEALELDGDGISWFEDRCTFCGNCEAVCPVGAIEVEI